MNTKLKEELLTTLKNELLEEIQIKIESFQKRNNILIEESNKIIEENKRIFECFLQQKYQLDKLENLEKIVNKCNDSLVSHEIRINNSSGEIAAMKTKYDKIVLDNLLLSGVIGPSCSYKNLSSFLKNHISDFKKLKAENDMIKNETKDFRIKLEGASKNITNLIDSGILRCNNYTDSRINDFHSVLENKIKDMNEKNMELRMKNIQFQSKIDEQIKNLKNEYEEKMKIQKEELIKEINNKIEYLNMNFLNMEKNPKFLEIDEIKNKLSELEKEVKEIKQIKQIELNIKGEMNFDMKRRYRRKSMAFDQENINGFIENMKNNMMANSFKMNLRNNNSRGDIFGNSNIENENSIANDNLVFYKTDRNIASPTKSRFNINTNKNKSKNNIDNIFNNNTNNIKSNNINNNINNNNLNNIYNNKINNNNKNNNINNNNKFNNANNNKNNNNINNNKFNNANNYKSNNINNNINNNNKFNNVNNNKINNNSNNIINNINYSKIDNINNNNNNYKNNDNNNNMNNINNINNNLNNETNNINNDNNNNNNINNNNNNFGFNKGNITYKLLNNNSKNDNNEEYFNREYFNENNINKYNYKKYNSRSYSVNTSDKKNMTENVLENSFENKNNYKNNSYRNNKYKSNISNIKNDNYKNYKNINLNKMRDNYNYANPIDEDSNSFISLSNLSKQEKEYNNEKSPNNFPKTKTIYINKKFNTDKSSLQEKKAFLNLMNKSEKFRFYMNNKFKNMEISDNNDSKISSKRINNKSQSNYKDEIIKEFFNKYDKGVLTTNLDLIKNKGNLDLYNYSISLPDNRFLLNAKINEIIEPPIGTDILFNKNNKLNDNNNNSIKKYNSKRNLSLKPSLNMQLYYGNYIHDKKKNKTTYLSNSQQKIDIVNKNKKNNFTEFPKKINSRLGRTTYSEYLKKEDLFTMTSYKDKK